MGIQVRIEGDVNRKLKATDIDHGVLFLDATGRKFVRLEGGALRLESGKTPVIYSLDALNSKCCFTDCQVAPSGIKATLAIGQAL